MPNGTKVIVDSSAKLGHTCPKGCAASQLFAGDGGLTCPVCGSVFVAEPPKASRRSKPEEE